MSVVGLGYMGALESHANELEEVSKAEVQKQITALASEDFKTREEAEAKLWKMGVRALSSLEAELESKDPEVRDRGADLVMKIRYGLPYDPEKEVKELMLKINECEDEDKMYDLVDDLYEKDELRVIIYLYKVHPNESMRSVLLEFASVGIYYEVSESLRSGEVVVAENLLKALPENGHILNALAAIYAHQGRLDKKIQELTEANKQRSALMLACYKQKGDLQAVLKWAEENDDVELKGRVALMNGDASGLIERLKYSSQHIKRSGMRPEKKLGLDLAEAIAQGDKMKEEMVLDKFSSHIGTTSNQRILLSAYSQMLLSGERGLFEQSFDRLYISGKDEDFREFALRYADEAENLDLILNVIHAPVERSELKKWALKWLSEAENVDENQVFGGRAYSELRKLYTAADLFNRKGDKQRVRDVMNPLLKRAAELDHDALANIVSEVIKRKMNWLVVEQIDGWNEKQAEAVGAKMYAQMSYLKHFSEYLEKNSPSKKAMLRKVCVLVGIDKSGKYTTASQLQKELQIYARSLKKEEKIKVLSGLYNATYYEGDPQNGLALLRELRGLLWDEEKPEVSKFDYQYILLLQGLGNWQELDELYSLYEEKDLLEVKDYALWYITLNKLNRVDQAQQKLKEFYYYSVNDPDQQVDVVSDLMRLGEAEEAVKLAESLLLTVDLDSHYAHQLLVELNGEENFNAKQGQWKKTLAFAKLYQCLTILSVNGMYTNRDQKFSASRLIRISKNVYMGRVYKELAEGNKKGAASFVKRVMKNAMLHGDVTEEVFPLLKKAGMNELFHAEFRKLFTFYEQATKKYPHSNQTLNGAAWAAATARMELDKAEDFAKKSLEINPGNGYVTDTLAEVYFARGDREKAVRYGELALREHYFGLSKEVAPIHRLYYAGPMQRKRLHYFKHAPLPSQ